MPSNGKRDPATTSLWVASGRHMGHGLQLALSTLLFLLVGWWLDTKLGTAPLLLIVGAFVGGTAGFYSLYRHVTAEPREIAKEDER